MGARGALYARRADPHRLVRHRVKTEMNTENTEQDLLGVLGIRSYMDASRVASEF